MGLPRTCSALALMIGWMLAQPSDGDAQQTGENDALVRWVLGTGGQLAAGDADGRTLSATIGQTVIDTPVNDDGVHAAHGFIRPWRTAWSGFWTPGNGSPDHSMLSSMMTGAGAAFALAGHPNPFTDRTTISYRLERAVHARLRIFDAAGRQVRLLADEEQTAGTHRLVWNGDDDTGGTLAAGAYYYRLETIPDGNDGSGAEGAIGMISLVR